MTVPSTCPTIKRVRVEHDGLDAEGGSQREAELQQPLGDRGIEAVPERHPGHPQHERAGDDRLHQ